MQLTLTFILPAIIVCLPCIALIAYYKLNKVISKKKIVIAGIIALLIGLLSPWLATFVSARGISLGSQPDDFVCATGAVTFLFFGYLFTFLATPILTLSLFLTTKSKQK